MNEARYANNQGDWSYDSSALVLAPIQEIRELWRYRDLLWLLILNSIKTRYKRSVLGVVWTLLNPLLNMLVLSIAFSALFRFDVQNYPVYILVGLLTWNFFSQTVTQAMHTLVWGSNLLKRIYLPRSIFSISVLGNGLMNLGLAFIPLLLIMVGMHHPISWTLLLVPLAVFLLALFTLGLALLLSTLAVFFTDIVDLFNIVVSAWFYLTPIIYPLDIIPPSLKVYLRWNPMTVFVDLFHSLIYEGQVPDLFNSGLAAGLAFGMALLGWWVFTRKSDEFTYRI
jgi:ABC-type polysaccharide/polyol phosphate export permease